MISTSGFHKHRIRENTNSIEAFCIKPSLICKMHLIDWKSNMMFTSSGQTFLVVKMKRSQSIKFRLSAQKTQREA